MLRHTILSAALLLTAWGSASAQTTNDYWLLNYEISHGVMVNQDFIDTSRIRSDGGNIRAAWIETRHRPEQSPDQEMRLVEFDCGGDFIRLMGYYAYDDGSETRSTGGSDNWTLVVPGTVASNFLTFVCATPAQRQQLNNPLLLQVGNYSSSQISSLSAAMFAESYLDE